MGKQLPFYSEKPYNYNFNREIKENRGTLYKVLIPLGKILIEKLTFSSVEVHGIENVPEKGGFILASNHVFGWDPITITYCMKGKRQMYFVAKEEFFHTFYTRIALLIFNGFPVKRGTADRESLNFSIRVVKEGLGLLIFPQGTRDKERKRPESAKSGVALIAREAHCPVLPVSIHSDMRKKRPNIVVRFGEVIPYEELGFTEGASKSKELKACTQKIMSRIGELWDKDNL